MESERVVIARSLSEGRLVLVDHCGPTVLLDLALPANCEGCFDIRIDPGVIATAYSHEHIEAVDRWDIRTGKLLDRHQLGEVYDWTRLGATLCIAGRRGLSSRT